MSSMAPVFWILLMETTTMVNLRTGSLVERAISNGCLNQGFTTKESSKTGSFTEQALCKIWTAFSRDNLKKDSWTEKLSSTFNLETSTSESTKSQQWQAMGPTHSTMELKLQVTSKTVSAINMARRFTQMAACTSASSGTTSRMAKESWSGVTGKYLEFGKTPNLCRSWYNRQSTITLNPIRWPCPCLWRTALKVWLKAWV